jgi:hypothetical protein
MRRKVRKMSEREPEKERVTSDLEEKEKDLKPIMSPVEEESFQMSPFSKADPMKPKKEK